MEEKFATQQCTSFHSSTVVFLSNIFSAFNTLIVCHMVTAGVTQKSLFRCNANATKISDWLIWVTFETEFGINFVLISVLMDVDFSDLLRDRNSAQRDKLSFGSKNLYEKEKKKKTSSSIIRYALVLVFDEVTIGSRLGGSSSLYATYAIAVEAPLGRLSSNYFNTTLTIRDVCLQPLIVELGIARFSTNALHGTIEKRYVAVKEVNVISICINNAKTVTQKECRVENCDTIGRMLDRPQTSYVHKHPNTLAGNTLMILFEDNPRQGKCNVQFIIFQIHIFSYTQYYKVDIKFVYTKDFVAEVLRLIRGVELSL
ncbi:hypothetical protein WN51_08641 [Melipona quadrifasciata]|uniref:Uncharacterized protein n=1 Tax=Melipona quadrifasciata TaxID=166423 RepID=A0A0N0U771_9HYME|nr:hypothetical protein WN51_08641 [Melipona quadrifasciata]